MTGVVCDRLRKAALGNVWSGMNTLPEVDDTDADLVERAWRVQLPKHKALLRWTYVRNASPDFICRRLQMPARPRSVFLLELARAETAIEKTLVGWHSAMSLPSPS